MYCRLIENSAKMKKKSNMDNFGMPFHIYYCVLFRTQNVLLWSCSWSCCMKSYGSPHQNQSFCVINIHSYVKKQLNSFRKSRKVKFKVLVANNNSILIFYNIGCFRIICSREYIKSQLVNNLNLLNKFKFPIQFYFTKIGMSNSKSVRAFHLYLIKLFPQNTNWKSNISK